MTSHIITTDLSVRTVIYDQATGLFPFSPRREIDLELVKQLKTSIEETGFWHPIVVRKNGEGIAGNHRFLANLEMIKDTGSEMDMATIPAVIVDCDESTAISIALLENEIREDLSMWETIRSLMVVNKRKPRVAKRVLRSDEQTIEQLKLWTDDQENRYFLEETRWKLHKVLTREWLDMINLRLKEFPDLRSRFLEQLKRPTWVQARSIDDLEQEINRALANQGKGFKQGETWNSQPTAKCLSGAMIYRELLETLQNTPSRHQHICGSQMGFCPHLILSPSYISQGDFTGKQGILLLDNVDSVCGAPNAFSQNSCFQQQELVTLQGKIIELESQGLKAISAETLREIKKKEEFIWECPILNGLECTPKTCLYANEQPAGYAMVIRPDDNHTFVCLHQTCGQTAQAALIDQEKEQQKIEKQRFEQTLNHLRHLTVQRTLFAQEDDRIGLLDFSTLEMLENLLIPDWDIISMKHILLGWQAAIKQKLVEETEELQLDSRQIDAIFTANYGILSNPPTDENTPQLFQQLRNHYIDTKTEYQQWLACQVLVRSWRDEKEIGNIEKLSFQLTCELIRALP